MTTMLETDHPEKFRPAGHVVLRAIGEDQLLVPVSSLEAHRNSVYPVNATGAFIWKSLCAGKGLAETIDAVVAEFSVSVDQAQTDCHRFVQELVQAELLEEVAE